MRTLFLFMMDTLDGYYEGPGHDISWHSVDDDFNTWSLAQLAQVDLMLFGRTTYELMAGYWPTARDDPETTVHMNRTEKVVFSRTLASADWENTRLVKSDAAAEVRRLKALPGKQIAIFGSGKLVTALAEEGLVDEFRIIIAPLALGSGTSLFAGLSKRLQLKLLRTQVFANGNVLLVYAPA